MIDYFETKSQPITMAMVIKAYRKVKSNKGSGGIDGMSWEDLDKDRKQHLYRLWNRLSSGSYFPPPVKEVEIMKQAGGVRRLGIPTILDRIAQEVVKSHLEQIMEPRFHDGSYGYRPGRSCHDAVDKTLDHIMDHDWVIDIDIQSFFDTIDHNLMMKAVSHYCKDKWVLLYVCRWLEADIMKEGRREQRERGTPQGGVSSPLLSNLFLHVVFDGWMQKQHPEKPFERYADDIIVHCKTEKQAQYVLCRIRERMMSCGLQLHPNKTQIVNLRGISQRRYPRKYNFLGFSIRPVMREINGRNILIPGTFVSISSKKAIRRKFSEMEIHRKRKPIEELARELNPIIEGIIQYFHKFWEGGMREVWNQLNHRLLKWVKWEKGLYKYASLRWLRRQYKINPQLFAHWRLVQP